MSISEVITWTHNPEPRDTITGLLEDLSQSEVGVLMQMTGAAGKLGWLEFGRRKGHIRKPHFDVVKVEGRIEVNVGIDSLAVVENISLDSEQGKGGN